MNIYCIIFWWVYCLCVFIGLIVDYLFNKDRELMESLDKDLKNFNIPKFMIWCPVVNLIFLIGTIIGIIKNKK